MGRFLSVSIGLPKRIVCVVETSCSNNSYPSLATTLRSTTPSTTLGSSDGCPDDAQLSACDLRFLSLCVFCWFKRDYRGHDCLSCFPWLADLTGGD
ncbi:hypothetical protein BaRGS_00036525 [Batillaria attramentaria]|uniref:Uncharacterized protein n=1 Tax=Batillaria attramentaria TaxID=370345 RepID=A0ABD0JBI9_9CAEN